MFDEKKKKWFTLKTCPSYLLILNAVLIIDTAPMFILFSICLHFQKPPRKINSSRGLDTAFSLHSRRTVDIVKTTDRFVINSNIKRPVECYLSAKNSRVKIILTQK